ncbi:MAG: hypothetical protein RIR97_1343 [Pseudomonadota bacterium]|jgi:hypothetical protein
MSNNDSPDTLDPPLDPVMEKVRRKMVRLQVISAGVMVVSLMAVLGAIVYKTTKPSVTAVQADPGIPVDSPFVSTANLPAGFAIASVSLSGTHVLFYGKTREGQAKALVVDSQTGRLIADMAIAGP